MKNWASKLRIHRTSTSPYFPVDFNHRETLALEVALPGRAVQMVNEAPFDVLITNTHTDFSRFSAAQLESIQLIIHPNSGYDNFTAGLVNAIKAPVVIGSSIRAQAVAQYVLSALFARVAPIPHHPTWDKDRQWKRSRLGDLKVTVMGHGHIGKIVTSALRLHGASPIIIDPFENLSGSPEDSDVLVLACGLNSSSRRMINAEFLKKISPHATIINAARGELVVSEDLINFLSINKGAHAFLDVFEQEPNDFSLFHSLRNVTTTSHIAGVFEGIDQATIDFEKIVVADFFQSNNFEEKYQAMILKNRIHGKELI